LEEKKTNILKDLKETIKLWLMALMFFPVFIVTLILGEERINRIFGDDDLI